jgi:hypothetical protein
LKCFVLLVASWLFCLPGPEAGAFLFYFFWEGVGFDPLGGVAEHAEEFGEVFGVEENAGFFDLVGVGLAFAFGEDEVVVAVVGLLDLGGVGAGADLFEEFLEENGVVGGGFGGGFGSRFGRGRFGRGRFGSGELRRGQSGLGFGRHLVPFSGLFETCDFGWLELHVGFT